jgi:hypothetical protein
MHRDWQHVQADGLVRTAPPVVSRRRLHSRPAGLSVCPVEQGIWQQAAPVSRPAALLTWRRP